MIFDLDGTLVDHDGAAEYAAIKWAASRGDTSPDVAARWAEVAARNYARYQTRELTFEEHRRRRIREFLGQSLADEVADAHFSEYLALYESQWRSYDDARGALVAARRAGLKIAVLTNGDEDQQRRKVDLCGLSDEIDLLVASSTLSFGKPHPDAFASVLDRLGLEAPSTLMVGDSLATDVQGAQDMGIRAVLVDRSDRHPDHPGPRVRSLTELVFA